ncbi:hypothetical protein BESB_029190 [Besnoitia besnoiti]|uniref:Transmembrane protein n=1 Tax=Besnoitia besnoiti TaxID=94643 RepID=A0A2A9M2P1_BESBE|nr:uncharacterized protein BESB_029190 [Besnoitia besnoiti]PFH31484.1 hypothetical protein BESB_029190 [Besnoitia besnoiti]
MALLPAAFARLRQARRSCRSLAPSSVLAHPRFPPVSPAVRAVEDTASFHAVDRHRSLLRQAASAPSAAAHSSLSTSLADAGSVSSALFVSSRARRYSAAPSALFSPCRSSSSSAAPPQPGAPPPSAKRDFGTPEPKPQEPPAETSDREAKLTFWIERLREDRDKGAVYMLKDILERPEPARGAAVAASSPLKKPQPEAGSAEAPLSSEGKQREEKEILAQLEDLVSSHAQMTAQVGELVSYRHQTRREGRKELMALGFTGFATAFAAAIHPFFFIGTLIGMRSLLKARAPERDREAGARRLQEIQDSMRTQERQIFALSERLLELEGIDVRANRDATPQNPQ